MQKQNKKIGLVVFWYPLGVSPTLINLANSLAEKKYDVQIFIDSLSLSRAPIIFKNKKIKVHRVSGIPEPGLTSGLLHTFKVLKGFNNFCRYLEEQITEDFSLIIGADTFGITAAERISRAKKIPLIYLNLELLLSNECHSLKDKVIKFYEKKASRRAYLVIIQDENRAKYLIRDNNLNRNKIVYLPVSGLNIYQKKNDYLQKKFQIPQNKKIILYAGEIAPWAMCLEIVQAAQKWPSRYILVIHASRITNETTDYLKQLRKADFSKKVIFSLEPVSWASVPKLLSSADIGLAFYKNLRISFTEIGFASGKLASYLQVGLPVITSNYPSLRKIIDQYQCGKYSNDTHDIVKLIREILKKYSYFRQNARRCFKEKYDMKDYFNEVYNRLKKIENEKKNSDLELVGY